MKNRIFKNCFSVVMALVMALSLNCAAFATYTNGPRNDLEILIMIVI